MRYELLAPPLLLILTIEMGKIVGAYPGGAVTIYSEMGDAEPLAIGEIIEIKRN